MGGKPSKSACKIRGIRIIGVENPSHSVQIIMKFTIVFVCFLSESGFGETIRRDSEIPPTGELNASMSY